MRSRKLRATAISGAKPASAAVRPPETRPHGRQPRDSHAAASWIDYANMGLMVLALGVASIVPFELFLISYAVLGPLHYLTEISWLHDRRFFLSRRTDWLPLFACAGLITLANPAVVGSEGQSWLNGFRVAGLGLADILQVTYWDLTFLAFATALVFVLTSSRSSRLVGVAIATAGAVLFHVGSQGGMGLYFRLFGVYLPTIIHVFFFTGAFILAGALKRRSLPGYASLAVFLICGGLAVWLPNVAVAARPEAAAVFWKGFQDLSFWSLQDIMHQSIYQLIGTNVFTSEVVQRLVRFLAFAYTYHYLNWFSKTSIIQWHAISKPRLAIVAVAWAASVAAYMIDYDLGLRWLFLLSLTHVVLEFPLNHKSFIDIGVELRRRLRVAT